jgi:hypothetical protein
VMAWEYPEVMAAAMTARMVVSEERILVVEQASVRLATAHRCLHVGQLTWTSN